MSSFYFHIPCICHAKVNSILCFHTPSTCNSGQYHSILNQSGKQSIQPSSLSPSLHFPFLLNLVFPGESLRWSFEYYWKEMHFQNLHGWYCQCIAPSLILFQRIFTFTSHLQISIWSQCLQKYCENIKAFLNQNLNHGLILSVIKRTLQLREFMIGRESIMIHNTL